MFEIWKRVSGLSNSDGWIQAGQDSNRITAQTGAQNIIINDSSIVETSVLDSTDGNEVASYLPWAPSYFKARTEDEQRSFRPLGEEAA